MPPKERRDPSSSSSSSSSNSSNNEPEDKDTKPSNDVVLTKYNMAAEIVNTVLKVTFENFCYKNICIFSFNGKFTGETVGIYNGEFKEGKVSGIWV